MIRKVFIFLLIIVSLSADEYTQWLASQQQEYNQYKKSLDDEFSDMLKKDWEAFKTMYTPSSYKKPKPKVLPKITKPKQIPIKELKKSKKIKPIKILKEKIKQPKLIKKQPIKDGYLKINFKFYGQNIDLIYDKKLKFKFFSIDKEAISKVWQKLSKADTKGLITQINNYKNQYKLNDWAMYLLIYDIGYNIYQDTNKTNLFTWYILTKMQYDCKIGYNRDNIYLLAKVKEKLYQVSFFNIKNSRYYILTPKGRINSVGSIFTYQNSYPNATKKLSFDMDKHSIAIYTNKKEKNFSFYFEQKKYNVSAEYSNDLINFYKTFPQSEYRLYFDSKKSPLLSNTLLLKLKPLIEGKSELEAVNLLLRFVQTAFRYKTDNEQFHYEKVFFPEETIYYPYSDCEDRSIIFSYLVKHLLNLEVVGIKYKDHLASAVHFSTNINGDGFIFKGKKFIITDPTYINANAGMTMPQYKDSRFTIISEKL